MRSDTGLVARVVPSVVGRSRRRDSKTLKTAWEAGAGAGESGDESEQEKPEAGVGPEVRHGQRPRTSESSTAIPGCYWSNDRNIADPELR